MDKIVAIDIETTGLDPNRDKINFIGFYNGTDSYIIECRDKVTLEYLPSLRKKLQQTIDSLKAKGYKTCLHNGKFDSKFIRLQLGIDLPVDHDTMMLAYCQSSAYELKMFKGKWLGLKDCAKNVLQAPDWDVDIKDKTCLDLAIVEPYLKKDLEYTYKLFHEIYSRLEAQRKKTYVLVMLASKMLLNMECNGLPINVEQMDIAEAKYRSEMDTALSLLRTFKDINWNSHPQMKKYLFEELDLPVMNTTKKGEPSTDENALIDLKPHHPIIEVLMEYRKKKQLWQFLRAWKEQQYEGKLYGNFNLHGTITGRLSSSGPNLQQIPREKALKTCFQSMDPEFEMVQFDFSQAEARMAAIVANEPSLKQVFKDGIDFHVKNASAINNKELADISKEERNNAKPVGFGLLYGMSAKGLVEYAKQGYGVYFTLQQAEQIRDAYFSLYSELPYHYRAVEDTFLKNGQYISATGRVYEVPPACIYNKWERSEWLRSVINFTVQGPASDFAVSGMIQIDQQMPREDVKLCATVHDSVILLIRKNKLSLYLPQIKRILEDPVIFKKLWNQDIKFDIPMKVDIEIGPWGIGVSPEEYFKAV